MSRTKKDEKQTSFKKIPVELSKKRELIELYNQATEHNSSDAQYNLWFIYNSGTKVPRDLTKARFWLEKAAQAGLSVAQYNLGLYYYRGYGTKKNYKKAMIWLLKAAEQGNAGAQFSVGLCYHDGHGVERSLKEAYNWFKKSSDQSNQDALMMVLHYHQNYPIVCSGIPLKSVKPSNP